MAQVTLNENDVALILSALHDLKNGWSERELADGWQEAAARVRAALAENLAEDDFPDFREQDED